MSKAVRFLFMLACFLLMTAGGCAERRIVTSVQDQAFVPAPVAIHAAPTITPPVEEFRVPERPIAAPEKKLEQLAASAPSLDLTDVFFDFDRFAIRSEGQAALEADYRVLKSASGHKLVVEGHCDERGTLEYNLVLGERRAHAVERYLENLGVPKSDIQIVSYGKERPFCSEHSSDCWQKNRRAHLLLQ
jgi:peptidoglycan-associated lipoprotein